MTQSRAGALTRAGTPLEDGTLLAALRRRVAHRTESQVPGTEQVLRGYLSAEIVPEVEALGFTARVVENPVSPRHPFLLARRVEDPGLPTVLLYGHGDVLPAHPAQWRAGLDPWELTVEGDRWYGRGVAEPRSRWTASANGCRSGWVHRRRAGRPSGSPMVRALAETPSNNPHPDLCPRRTWSACTSSATDL